MAETIPHEVASHTRPPDSGIQASQPGINVNVITEDGYNWRKYGQKQVKGNQYVRSYYKCTHLKCLVKKRVEKRTRDGHIIDTLYFGMHHHPKCQSTPPMPLAFVLVPLAQDNSCDMVPINDNDMESTPQSLKIVGDGVNEDEDSNVKRQKKDVSRADSTPREKQTGEPRIFVQTLTEVDIVNDGHRWRKYGQKFVKGNPNPRSYYRCSRSGCPVKKHVERAGHDSKVVLTTYEGKHDHDMPPARIVNHNPAGTCVDAVCHEMVVHSCSIPENNLTEISSIEAMKNITTCYAEKKSSEQPNGKPSIKSEESGIVGHTSSDHESDSKNQPDNKVNPEIEVHASSCPCLDNLITEPIQSRKQ